MAKIRREEVIAAALDLLNQVGLDGLSTRRLAQRLGVGVSYAVSALPRQGCPA